MRSRSWYRLAGLVGLFVAVSLLPGSPAAAGPLSTSLGPAASSSGSRTFATVIDAAGHFAYRWWDANGPVHGWTMVPPNPREQFASDAPPAVALVANGTYVFLIAKATNGQLYLNQGWPTNDGLYDFLGWQHLSGTAIAAPAAASSGNRSVAVYTRADGRMFYDWWDLGGGGHGFREVPGGGLTDAAPAVTLVANGTYMFVLAKGLDNRLWVNQGTPGGAFAGWRPMDVATNVAPGAAASANRSAALITTPDGRILYDWWDLGGGGHGFHEIDGGGRTNVSPAAGFVDSGALLYPLVTGRDGNVYTNQGAPGGSFSGWHL